MRYVTAGESHGRALVTIVNDVPAGIAISGARIGSDLARRQSGYGRGGRMDIEHDSVTILSGVRFGKTIGSPVALQIDNRDWGNWSDRMATEGAAPADLQKEQTPRPGHADLPGAYKIATDDCRNVLERASARETAARVAAGGVAKAFLTTFGVEVASYVTRIGDVAMSSEVIERKSGLFSHDKVEASSVRCPDGKATGEMEAAIDDARARGVSLGGWFNVTATGLVPGIGGYASAADRLDGRIAGAVVSIPAVKGVEFGLGFEAGKMTGDNVHDAIIRSAEEGRIQPVRATNNAGGIEGGMTNGEAVIVHAVMKPIPTMTSALRTVDMASGEAAWASKERSDVCAVPACAVVAEAELAMVLADAYMDAFGRNNMTDIHASFDSYVKRISR
ncbi:MAG: chorismate synthase [Coriobacteriales bacterium]|nr:chorismate synthase [Coriobacteriales bacterium]